MIQPCVKVAIIEMYFGNERLSTIWKIKAFAQLGNVRIVGQALEYFPACMSIEGFATVDAKNGRIRLLDIGDDDCW